MVATMYLRALESRIHNGSLQLHLANGTSRRLGRGDPLVHWFLHRPDCLKRILRNPARMLAETYVRDEWHVQAGQLPQLLALLLRNIPQPPRHPWREAWQRWRTGAERLLGQHDPTLFDDWLLGRFLDSGLHYQCGYYRDPDVSLEEAQRTMCHRLLNKLRLQPGQHVLDLNANWGGLPLYLAEQGQVRVTALVRSHAQLQYARQRAQDRGLQHRVHVLHQDHQELHGCYDRVIGLGVLEALQPRQYPGLFQDIGELLAEDGLALLHCVGRLGAPGTVNPWVQPFLSPCQYNPALSELSQGVERGGLFHYEVELLHDHYACTLAAWQGRFQRHRTDIARRMGERFCRVWEFYLAAAEAGFRCCDLALFEWQLGRTHRPAQVLSPRPTPSQSAPEFIRRLQQEAAGKGV